MRSSRQNLRYASLHCNLQLNTGVIPQGNSMPSDKPLKVAIDHDDYHAKHVGVVEDGHQFFLTTPFEPAIGGKDGGEYVALFIFDEIGNLTNSFIDGFGPRSSYDREGLEAQYEERLKQLGNVKFTRIEVKPFSVEYKGINFGLIPREPEDEEDIWAVELLPGNYMAFFEPWDSGEYDT
jgi:hypothetical protein